MIAAARLAGQNPKTTVVAGKPVVDVSKGAGKSCFFWSFAFVGGVGFFGAQVLAHRCRLPG
jgi:hypothetical protein